MVTIETGQSTR